MNANLRKDKIKFIRYFVEKYKLSSINIANLDELPDGTITSCIRQIAIAHDLAEINNEQSGKISELNAHVASLIKENQILRLRIEIRDSEECTEALRLQLYYLLNEQKQIEDIT